MKLHPFVKWVGGKTQLLNEIVPHIPEGTQGYVELFVGGGAVFFEVLNNRDVLKIDYFLINDTNRNLINAYQCVFLANDFLIKELVNIGHDFSFAEDKKEFYYKQRELYNDFKFIDEKWIYTVVSTSKLTDVCKQAARFIFLNKTCFNGLYRVNKYGRFNVPFNGTDTVSFDIENIKNIGNVTKEIALSITCGDYRKAIPLTFGEFTNTFVYLDPPYKPIKSTGTEVSYTKEGFGDKEQEELKEYCDKLTENNIKFIQSNSDPEDKFFDKLYSNYNIKRVQARRNINSNGTKRGKINEILISNFDIQ